MKINNIWIVTQRFHTLFIIMGYAGFGFLFSSFEKTDSIWVGYIIAGVVMMIAYNWELKEA